MDAHDSLTPDAQQKLVDRKRKRKAILAGGVVLGLGAAITLAAWSDDVFANGTFGTGTFELQGNVYGADAAGYENYDTSPGGDLSFVVDPGNMAPGDTVYAPISLNTTTATSTDAEVTLNGAAAPSSADPENPDGPARLFSVLTYEVNTIAAGGTCDADIFSDGEAFHGPTALDVDMADTFTVVAEGATPVHLCFAVNLPDDEITGADNMQGLTTAPVVWQFSAESVSVNPEPEPEA